VLQACGDVISLSIRVESEIIVDSKVKVFGCGSAIASGSYTTELIIGKTLEEAAKVTNRLIAGHLNLPPVKLHCSMLSEDAIHAAINDWRSKNEQPLGTTKKRL